MNAKVDAAPVVSVGPVNFGNDLPIVKPDEVAKVREATKDRTLVERPLVNAIGPSCSSRPASAFCGYASRRISAG